MYCQNCGAYLQRNHRFCTKCGTPVTSNIVKQFEKKNSLSSTLSDCKRFNSDTFSMFTALHCEYCSKYGRNSNGKAKVYSISGTSKKYPSMMIIPSDLVIGEPCPVCNKHISFGVFLEGVSNY